MTWIKILCIPDLYDLAGVHDGDTVGDRHRLFLITGHRDDRASQLFLQSPDLTAHLGVEI